MSLTRVQIWLFGRTESIFASRSNAAFVGGSSPFGFLRIKVPKQIADLLKFWILLRLLIGDTLLHRCNGMESSTGKDFHRQRLNVNLCVIYKNRNFHMTFDSSIILLEIVKKLIKHFWRSQYVSEAWMNELILIWDGVGPYGTEIQVVID